MNDKLLFFFRNLLLLFSYTCLKISRSRLSLLPTTCAPSAVRAGPRCSFHNCWDTVSERRHTGPVQILH